MMKGPAPPPHGQQCDGTLGHPSPKEGKAAEDMDVQGRNHTGKPETGAFGLEARGRVCGNGRRARSV